jgi:hypothetical protein
MKKLFVIAMIFMATSAINAAPSKVTIILDSTPRLEVKSDVLFYGGTQLPADSSISYGRIYNFPSGIYMIVEVQKNDQIFLRDAANNRWNKISYKTDIENIGLSKDNNCYLKITSVEDDGRIISGTGELECPVGFEQYETIFSWFTTMDE